MLASYRNIPLQLLLKKEEFDQAKSIYINAFSVDLHFVQTYLCSMREDALLFISAESLGDGVLEFFKQKPNRPFHHSAPRLKRILGVKNLLLDLETYKLTALSSCNFTKFGLEDELAHHKISTKNSTYELFHRQYRSRFPNAFN